MIQRSERPLFVESPEEIPVYSLRELYFASRACSYCERSFSSERPPYNSYISFVDGSHVEGVCRDCSTEQNAINYPDPIGACEFTAPRLGWHELPSHLRKLLETPVEDWSSFKDKGETQ